MDRPAFVRIEEISTNTPTVKTFYFDYPPAARAKPGQFLMVNVLGIDEIPISLSGIGDRASITVRRVGEATERLHDLGEGDVIGVRGPYGRGFSPIEEGNILIAGGGIGVAPLLPLTRQLCRMRRVKLTVVLGASTRDELLFVADMERYTLHRGTVLVATDDGSCGAKGPVTALAHKLLKRGAFDAVFTCGPEPMMKRLFEQCEGAGVPLQASLDRYMRCGIGICGSCCVGKYRVCKDGPVLSSAQLREVADEFGRFTRDACGRRTGLSSPQ